MTPQIAWALYILAVCAGFWALEYPALRNDVEDDTLTEVTRIWIALGKSATPGRTIRRIAFCVITAGAGIWFIVHVLTALV